VDLIPVARLTGWKKFILNSVRQFEVCRDAFDHFVWSSRPTKAAKCIE
jgi:hypothetical protein